MLSTLTFKRLKTSNISVLFFLFLLFSFPSYCQIQEIACPPNGIDDDGDGMVDEIDGNTAGAYSCSADADGDFYGAIPSVWQCGFCGPGETGLGGDCDDADPNTYPCAPEIPDGKDNDCDGMVDETTSEDVILNSQTDVNNLLLLCGQINNLVIESLDPADPIVDLFPLGQIFEIQGDVVIRNNPQLSNFALNGLGQSSGPIGGNLIIENNPLLVNLNELFYDPVGGNVEIIGNDGLVSLFDFSSPSTIGGDILVYSNPMLQLATFPTTTNVSGEVAFELNNLLQLMSFDPTMTNLPGDLIVKNNGTMSALSGLELLSSISGDITITNNPSLDICHITAVCDKINMGGNITISGNDDLCVDVPTVDDLCDGICPPKDFTFNSQADITNYIGCAVVNGNITIESTDSADPITDLSGLGIIEEIHGNLTITNSGGIVDLLGLTNLNKLTGNLSLTNNANLNYCHIQYVCDFLALSGSATISGNDTDCIDQTAVENKCGFGICIGDLKFETQTEVDNFSGCTTVQGNVEIKSNSASDPITDLSNLNPMVIIEGNLRIHYNDQLTSIPDFSNLLFVEGSLDIDYNDILSSISGFDELIYVKKDFSIGYNPELLSIPSFDNLELACYYVGSGNIGFGIVGNDKLTSITGFNKILETTTGRININNNDALTHIDGFNQLEFIGKRLTLTKNNELVSIAGFGALKEIDDALQIEENPKLTSIPEFNQLEKINSNSSVFKGLVIYDNDMLTSISGLNNLILIKDTLRINANASLSDISGLNNGAINLIGEVIIKDNASLSDCSVEMVCHHIAKGGTSFISNNTGNCNGISDVEAQCEDKDDIIDPPLDACILVATINFNSTNDNYWHDVFDASGNILCSIRPNGNNLGSTDFSVYKSSSARTAGIPYMDRDIVITPTNQPTSFAVSIRMYYTQQEFLDLQAMDPSIMTVADLDFTKTTTDCDGVFTGAGNFVSQTGSGTYGTGGDIYVQGNVSSFSTFYAHGQNTPLTGTLPVELLSFTSDVRNEQVGLHWATATEINFDSFELEHSVDNLRFEKLVKIESGLNSYHYLHKFPEQGNNYYRLKMMDLDGSIEYSNVLNERIYTKHDIGIYPNPSQDEIHIISSNSNTTDFVIYDKFGREVLHGESNDQQAISIEQFPSGVYIIQLQNGLISKSISLVKI